MPIRLRNIPKEVVMTSEFPDDIRVRVEDRVPSVWDNPPKARTGH